MRWRVVLLAAMAGVALCAPAPASALSGFDVSGVENEPLGAGVAGDQEGVELAPVDLGDPSTQVTITWGDGQMSTCVLESSPPTSSPAPACWFWDGEADVSAGGVYGAHAYAEPDVESGGKDVPYAWTITAPGETITGTATIADAPLTVGTIFSGGGPPPISELAGVAAPVEVATFSDADPDPHLSNYQATVNWGDGTASTAGAVGVGSGAGHFEVTGSHAYAAAGTYTVTTSITDQIPGHVGYGPVQATVSATVTEAGVESLSAEEGTPFSGVIAQFCGESGSPSSVSIDWGDGSAVDTATTLAPGSSSCLDVSAGHTYAEGGSYTVTVTPSPSSWAAPVSGTATVADAPLTATFDATALAAVGSSFTIPNTQLATVVDANPDAPSCGGGGACDISATINWGDGSSSAGTVTPVSGGGGLAVDGSHTYSGPGEYTITVNAHDVHGASAVATGTYTVAPPPPAKADCLSSIPAVGATSGRFGKSLAPGPPNWGLSADDRVVRFGDLVVCAVDAPWTYEGAPLQTGGSAGAHGQTPGLFQTTGRIIVNGIELQPATQASGTPYLLDTEGGGELSGPQSEVWLTEEQYAAEPALLGDLGPANLTSDPWVVEDSTLGVVPASSSASVDDLPVEGSLPITVTGLGTVKIAAAVRLPDALTLAAYSGGPVTATHTFEGEYPALAPPSTAPASTCGNECFASAQLAPLAPIGLLGAGGGRARVADDYPCTLQIPPDLPIHLTFPSAFLGGLPVTNGYLDYDPSNGTLDGGAIFSIGGASVSGFFSFVNGSFNGAGGCASGLDVPIIPELLQLDGISFDTFLNPTRFNATATLGLVGLGSGGSVIDVQGGTMAVFATGSHTYTYNQDESITGQDDIPGTDSILYGQPFSTTAIGIGGQYSPFGLPLTVKGYALYVFPGYVEFGGSWGINVLGGALTANLSGAGQLWAPQGEFEIQANGSFNVAGFGGSVGIVLSSKGIIGCGNVNIPDPPPISGTLATLSEGAGYHWGQGLGGVNIWLFGGCSNNYGSYQVNASSSALDDGSRSFTIGRGLPDVMVRLAGSGGSPEVRVTGPDGEAASTGTGTQLTGGRFGGRVIALARMPQLDRTWIGLEHPAAGRWTVTPLPGSAAMTSLAVADGLGPAVVHATVTGHGYDRVLDYSVRPRPGQAVQFAESGTGASHLIGTAHGSHGTLRFTPEIGPAGRRSILAIVSMSGLPTERLAVASYLAPGPPVAGAPRGLAVRRVRGALAIRWRAGADTTGFHLTVIDTDGARSLYILPRRARTFTAPGPPDAGAAISLAGVGPDGNAGPAATVRIAAPSRPGRVRGLRAVRRKATVQIGWQRVAGARVYRVAITAGSSPAPSLTVTAGRSLTVAVNPADAVHVTVWGEGAPDLLGPAASVRLAAVQGHRGK
jgi:hypothetical protein